MSRPDDSYLTPDQLANVRRHADRLLRDAAALERFPTPIDDILAAAKVTVVDDEILNESFMKRLAAKAAAGFATIKSALSKVLGLFEAHDRLVVIDKDIPRPGARARETIRRFELRDVSALCDDKLARLLLGRFRAGIV